MNYNITTSGFGSGSRSGAVSTNSGDGPVKGSVAAALFSDIYYGKPTRHRVKTINARWDSVPDKIDTDGISLPYVRIQHIDINAVCKGEASV